MKKNLIAALAAIAAAGSATAQSETEAPAPGPTDIVNAAPQEDWAVIPAEDLLVMTLAPAADGSERKVVIQLMPAPFSQGWVENIRALARAEWYDGITVNRVQDNYVVQWGDPGHDNPESGETETKPLPEGLNVMDEADYLTDMDQVGFQMPSWPGSNVVAGEAPYNPTEISIAVTQSPRAENQGWHFRDSYADFVEIIGGWPMGSEDSGRVDQWGVTIHSAWPLHCYGMVGVGRSYSPDTGSGAELYTVIGHAPRHLDRNIALVGRIISGMQYLTSLPRGSGALGFYTEEEAELRTPIIDVRVASDLPEGERPQFEELKTANTTFERYVAARAARRDPFFIHPAGGIDICNIPIPIRPFEYAD